MTITEVDDGLYESLEERMLRELLNSRTFRGVNGFEEVPVFKNPLGKPIGGYTSLAMVLRFYGITNTPAVADVPNGYEMTPSGLLKYVHDTDPHLVGDIEEPKVLTLGSMANLTKEIAGDRLVPTILGADYFNTPGRVHPGTVRGSDPQTRLEQIAHNYLQYALANDALVIMRPLGNPAVAVGVDTEFPFPLPGQPMHTSQRYLFHDPINGRRAIERHSFSLRGNQNTPAEDQYNMLTIRRRIPRRRAQTT